jgi:hypothetical protein
VTGWTWWWGFVIFASGMAAGAAAMFIWLSGRKDD